MKANEFVKQHGWKEAKSICHGIFTGVVCYKWVELNIDDLKRLVESHDLAKEHGSLGRAKEYADSAYTAPEVAERLHAAIADVESCMEGL